MTTRHVIPINDLTAHSISVDCLCNPRADKEDEYVIIHNSFDGRELKQQAIEGNGWDIIEEELAI